MKSYKFLVLIILLLFATITFSQTFEIPITSQDSLFNEDGVAVSSEMLEILNSSYIDYVKGEKYTNESRQFSNVFVLSKNESNVNFNYLLLKYPYNLTDYTCYLLCMTKDYKRLISLIEIIIHGGPIDKSFMFIEDKTIIVKKESEENGTELRYTIRPEGYFELISFEKYKVW